MHRRWEKDYSGTGIWDPTMLGKSIGGAVLLEIRQQTSVICVPSQGRVDEWTGIEGIDMSATPVHTALAWPSRR